MILISPAKNLNLEPYELEDHYSSPTFNKKTKKLISILDKLNVSDIKNLMNISESLADLNSKRFSNFSDRGVLKKPAVFLFSGDTFNGLSINSFDKDSLFLAQKKLRILSGLYGILKPLDLISPYRLEMGTNTKFILGQSLVEFWKKDITDSLKKDILENDSDYLFNLASKEYFSSIDESILKTITVNFDFKRIEKGKLFNIGMAIKKCRGSMAKFLIQNKVKNLKDIKYYSDLGFNFHSFDEKINNFVFCKK
tara:strand:+ start:68 stop:826 length:759 start_codon:yes stop_codon:yes gene_type:complete